jgi:hypothetical protein
VKWRLRYRKPANNFAALDRFGRVIDQLWTSYGENPGVLDEYTYTYDRAGNRTSRGNATDAALKAAGGHSTFPPNARIAIGESTVEEKQNVPICPPILLPCHQHFGKRRPSKD